MSFDNFLRTGLLLSIILLANPSYASTWYTNTGISITNGQYKKSELRKEAFSTSLQVGFSYLEQWGINFRAAYSSFIFKQGINDIKQNEYGARFYKSIFSDSANGTFTLLLGNYWINGKDIDTTITIYPEITYLNRSKSFLIGLGYANSQYNNSNNLSFRADQLSATVGFTPMTRSLWINIKNYLITFNNETQYAMQPTLSWFIPKSIRIYPSILSIGGLIGERSYAVEQETMLTYNISDEQQYSYFASAQWSLTDNSHFSLTIGSEVYHDDTNNNNYQYNYINGGLSAIW